MITIQYENEITITDVDPALTLLEVSLRNNIPHIHACGGNARCSTCRVAVTKNLENCAPRNPAEYELARSKGLDKNIRLACQTRVHGPVTIRRLVIDDEDMRDASAMSNSGQEKQLAILFSDIRSFTPFTEQNMPYDVVHVMNRYFRRMGDAIQRYDGYIDKYIGDGLMALFGLSLPSPGDPALISQEQRIQNARQICRNAVSAALDMQTELVEVNRYLRSHLDHEFRIGVGLHFGDVIVGEMGHPDKRQFTALGDNVNTASRIESVTKKADVPLLISQDVFQILEDELIVAKRFRTKLKGKSGDYRLYSVSALNSNVIKTPSAPPITTAAISDARELRQYELQILEVRTVADHTLAFLLDTSEVDGFEFQPGQYVVVRIPGIADARVFSIASASRIKDFILIATRIRDSEFKRQLQTLSPGDTLIVGDPEGTLALPADVTQPVVFLVGGIGITPVRAMIEETVDSAPERPLLLMYANRDPQASAFVPELQEWINHLPNAELQLIYSREEIPGAEYGRINESMIQKHVTSFEHMLQKKQVTTEPPIFYVVGPDAMTLDTVGMLERIGIPANRIHLEAFYGYQ